MKFFHKKFLYRDNEYKDTYDHPVESKTKIGYFLNQFLIWSVIFCIVFAMIKFLFVDYS